MTGRLNPAKLIRPAKRRTPPLAAPTLAPALAVLALALALASPASAQTCPDLHAAADTGDLAAVQCHVDAGTDLNAKAPNGRPPLRAAGIKGHAEVIRLLLKEGANPNEPDNGGVTPLFGPALNGHLEAAKILLEFGANANAVLPSGTYAGTAPLHDAANNGHLDLVNLLMRQPGVNLNPVRMGDTPLDLATNNGHDLVVRLLTAGTPCANENLLNRQTSGDPCLPSVKISFSASGGGTLSVSFSGDPDLQNGDPVPQNAAVTFAAVPDDDHSLKRWGDDCAQVSADSPACELTAATDLTVSAEFISGCRKDIFDAARDGDLEQLQCNLAAGTAVNAITQADGPKTPLDFAWDFDNDERLHSNGDGGRAVADFLIARGGHWGTECADDMAVNPAGPEPPCVSCAAAGKILQDGQCVKLWKVEFSADGVGILSAARDGDPRIFSGDTVPDGATITFTAAPDSPESQLAKWDGACENVSSSTTTCEVEARADVTVTAEFSCNGNFHSEVRACNPARVQCHLDDGADPDAPIGTGSIQFRSTTPLALAAIDNCPDAAAALVKAGADLNKRTLVDATWVGDDDYLHYQPNGRTPLHYAVLNGRLAVARILLEAGANVNQGAGAFSQPIYRTPLRYALVGLGRDGAFHTANDGGRALANLLIAAGGRWGNDRPFICGPDQVVNFTDRIPEAPPFGGRPPCLSCPENESPSGGFCKCDLGLARPPGGGACAAGPAVSFSVSGGEGVLTAARDGVEIQSGESVPSGTTVTFTADPNLGAGLTEWGGACATVVIPPELNRSISKCEVEVTEAVSVSIGFACWDFAASAIDFLEAVECNLRAGEDPNQLVDGETLLNQSWASSGGGLFLVPEIGALLIAAGAHWGTDCAATGRAVNPNGPEPPCLPCDANEVSFRGECAAKRTVEFSYSVGGTVSAGRAGDGEILSGEAVPVGAVITFTAAPEPGHRLSLWGGACAGVSADFRECAVEAGSGSGSGGVSVSAGFVRCPDFHDAAWAGDLAGARCNLDDKADVNAPDDSGRTPLHNAADRGHSAMVSLLLAAGADVNLQVPDEANWTALHLAVDGGRVGAVSLLAAAANVSLDARDDLDLTPLLLAGEGAFEPGPWAEVMEILLAAGADATVRAAGGKGVLHYAAEALDRPVSPFSREAGLVPVLAAAASSAADARDGDGWTALHYARLGRVASALLENGAEVNATVGADGASAADFVGADFADIAVRCGGPPTDCADRVDQGQTPLHTSARRGDSGVVAALLAAADVSVNATGDDGETPLQKTWNDQADAFYSAAAADLIIAAGGHWGTACATNQGLNPFGPEVNPFGPDPKCRMCDPTAETFANGRCECLSGFLRPAGGEMCLAGWTAEFSTSGGGTLTAGRDGDSEVLDGELIPVGATVIFTAVPAPGHALTLWGGACAGVTVSSAECEVSSAAGTEATVAAAFGCARPPGYAAWLGDLAGVRCHLDSGTGLNAPDRFNSTPLHHAAFGGHAAVVSLLLTMGAAVNPLNDRGETPLLLAWTRHGGVLPPLGESSAPDEGDPARPGQAGGRQREVFRMLFAQGGNWGVDCAAASATVNPAGPSPPCLCASGLWSEAGQRCEIERTISLSVAGEGGGSLTAGREGDAEILSGEAVPDGATVTFTAVPADGSELTLWTGLCLGESASADLECVRPVAADATVGAEFGCQRNRFHGGNQTFAAVECNLKAGRDVNERGSVAGSTPLGWAAFGGDAALVSLLLDYNADVNAADNTGRTPLYDAADAGESEVAAILLSASASVNVQIHGGLTPLARAAQRDNVAVVSLLLEAQADPALGNDNDDTPLHFALNRTELVAEIVTLLVEGGADVNAENQNGGRPLGVAILKADTGIKAHSEIIPYLIENGANHGEACEAPDRVNPSATSPACLDYVSVSLSLSAGGTVSVSFSGDADVQGGEGVLVGAAVTFTALPESGRTLTLWTGACAGDSVDDSECVLAAVAADVTVGAEFGCADPSLAAVGDRDAAVACRLAEGTFAGTTNPDFPPPESVSDPADFRGQCEGASGMTLAARDANANGGEFCSLSISHDGGTHAGCYFQYAAGFDKDNISSSDGGAGLPDCRNVIPFCPDSRKAISGNPFSGCRPCADSNRLDGEPFCGECLETAGEINGFCVDRTKALAENRATCEDIFSGAWVDLSGEHGEGSGVCSEVDINDTFCLAHGGMALRCLGLFNHVRSCNFVGRPALDPWHCGRACAEGKSASGARCLDK